MFIFTIFILLLLHVFKNVPKKKRLSICILHNKMK